MLWASDPSVLPQIPLCWHGVYMVYAYVLLSTKQGTTLHLAFSFNIVYTYTHIDAGNLEKSDTHVKEVCFNTLPNISHHYWNPFWSPPSSISISPKGHMNEALAPPAHQEELTPTLYNKDKAFSFNSKVTRTTAHQRKTAEEIKGIPRHSVRWKKVKRAKLLSCFVDLRFCWHPCSVINLSVYIKIQIQLQPCHEFHANSSL